MLDSALSDDISALSEMVHADLRQQIVSGSLALPCLSDVVWKLMQFCSSDKVDARQLPRLIHRDSPLVGQVLHIVNSPAYMARTPITSLQQAANCLGTNVLAEIAFAAALQSRVFNVKGYDDIIRTLWKHAVGTAAFAKEIARMRRQNVEGAFLCGLLHDIGKPVILQTVVDLQKSQDFTLEPSIISAIMEAYHTRVGSLIATAWSLPRDVGESIAYHHDYLAAPTCCGAVMITRLADCLSYHLMLPDVFNEQSIRQHPVLTDMHLYPDDVETLLARREIVLQIIESLS